MKFENTRVYNFAGAFHGMRNPKESWHLSDSEFGLGMLKSKKAYANEYLALWNPEKEDFTEEEQEQAFQQIVLFSDLDLFEYATIGPNDMRLAQTLIKSGTEHRKFMRQIFVSVDITAPLYWFKEFDTYKVGTVANSTSTMHKIASKPIALESFEIDDFYPEIFDDMAVTPEDIADMCEILRLRYLTAMKDADASESESQRESFQNYAKKIWKELIRWLPDAWLQTRTVTMNYENLLAICSKGQRRFHKLNEWSGQDNGELVNFIAWARTLPYAKQLIFIDEN